MWWLMCLNLLRTNNKNNKRFKMKKLILMGAMSFALLGCNSGENDEDGEVVVEYTVKVIEKKNGSKKSPDIRGSYPTIASTYSSQAQQIAVASLLYRANTNSFPTSVDDLIGEYMVNAPNPPKSIKQKQKWKIDEKNKLVFIKYEVSEDHNGGFTEELCTSINDNSYRGDVYCYADMGPLSETIKQRSTNFEYSSEAVILKKLNM